MKTHMCVFARGLAILGLACAGGCAVAPAPTTSIRNDVGVLAGPLLAPQLVAGEGTVELQGPELTPEARAKFRKERAARVSERSRARKVPLTAETAVQVCIYMGIAIPVVGWVACPIGLPLAYVSVQLGRGIEHGVKYAAVSLTEPSLRLSAHQAERVSAALTERATSAALVERALYTAPGQFVEATESKSRLVIRIRAAQACEAQDAVAICLIAEARAFAADGAVLSQSEHVFVHGPLMALIAQDDGQLERTIDEGLDLLAESIVAEYTRTGPLANDPEEKAPEIPAPPLLPAAGDSWTYRLSERGRGERTHRVTVMSASASAIRERREAPGENSPEAEHPQGAYLFGEGAVSLFSPYLASFRPEDLATTRVANMDTRYCDVRWFCSTTVRMAGSESVRVPAGEFQAIRLEVQQVWSPRSAGSGAFGGERTLTVWYSPQVKRAVKFSSRGSRTDYLRTDFDLDLVEYAVSQAGQP